MYLSLLRLCACFVWGQRMYALVDQRVHAIALSDTPLTRSHAHTLLGVWAAIPNQASQRSLWLANRTR